MNIDYLEQMLKNDKVGVLPTDTVYGLVGRLESEAAVARIYELKRRDPPKPVGTILIAHVNQIKELTDPKILAHAATYWPGSVSVILPLGSKFHYAHKGYGGLPFRVPDEPKLLELLERTGPLATSSANIEGQPPAMTLAQAESYFGDQANFYVDGGDLSGRTPSRIIEILSDGSEKEIRA